MSKAGVSKSTKVTGSVLSAEQAKQRIYAQGITVKEFAERRGLRYRIVSEVLRGVNKGLFGEGHKAAVALGMKRG